MSQRTRNPQLRSLIIRSLIVLTVIVWISSFIQLSFFSQILSSKSLQKIGYLWGGGLIIDVMNVLYFTLPGLVTGKTASHIPISLLLYLPSIIFYGQPCIFLMTGQPVFIQSTLKVIEFWLIMLFHLICSIALPKYIEDCITHRRK